MTEIQSDVQFHLSVKIEIFQRKNEFPNATNDHLFRSTYLSVAFILGSRREQTKNPIRFLARHSNLLLYRYLGRRHDAIASGLPIVMG